RPQTKMTTRARVQCSPIQTPVLWLDEQRRKKSGIAILQVPLPIQPHHLGGPIHLPREDHGSGAASRQALVAARETGSIRRPERPGSVTNHRRPTEENIGTIATRMDWSGGTSRTAPGNSSTTRKTSRGSRRCGASKLTCHDVLRSGGRPVAKETSHIAEVQGFTISIRVLPIAAQPTQDRRRR
ncbi:MAG: hypothetical protein QOF01_4038, partial [Thermomicrobiales bacterium]|nr:hypothetical protein [Thermomicrobiales bacterium]